MSSTFLGLNTSYTGLQAANAALNTTANNIANVETEGYSRQKVTTQAADSIRAFTTYGCVGAGVETLAIERIRDQFYDEKYWDNNQKLGEYEVKDYYMACIEEYYSDDDTIEGFTTIFEDFYSMMQELAKNADDATVKQQAIGYAGNLCAYFNDMYTNLQKLQEDINQEIKINVDRINSLSQEIASLNKQINVIEMNSGVIANELRDQRDLMIDELSEIVDVNVSETDIIDTNDPSRKTGGTRYRVEICGQTLVDGSDFKTMTCIPRDTDESTNLSDVTGMYDVYFKMDDTWTVADYRNKGDMLNMYSASVGGKLSGLVQMRDGNNGEYFNGTVTSVDVEAQSFTVSVDSEYLLDLNKSNLPADGGIINVGNNQFYYESWSFEMNEDTGECTYTFQLDKEENGTNTINQTAATKLQEATIGAEIKYQGIPYYLNQMNEWVRTFAREFNTILQGGVLNDGSQGQNLFVGTDPVSGEEYDFGVSYKPTGTAGNVITVDVADDSYYRLNAGNLKIAHEINLDPNKLATRSDQYSGVDDNDIVLELIDLKTNKEKMTFRGCAADQYLVCMLSDVAMNGERANNFTESYRVLKSSISNQRLNISGVDNDEEAVNLTKFQQQYNMASKMIQVLSEVYDRLILQTGV